ncbi:MAG: YigZ family protein [Eggerthellaceae bacterium]|nr:YigZ family protein [Eggerthellaceae bacterium]
MTYTTISNHVQAEYVVKKSRFIAQLAPIHDEEDAFNFIHSVKAEHRMARHNVHAFIVQQPQGNQRIRFSDDGEPAKTAGLPILNVLQGFNMVNVCCVVTRYFGGTLLGTGGLMRAYSTAARNAIESTTLHDVAECNDVFICAPYGLISSLEHIAQEFNAKSIHQDFHEEVKLTYRILHDNRDAFMHKIEDLGNGALPIAVSETFYASLDA